MSALRAAWREANRAQERRVAEEFFDRVVAARPDWRALAAHPDVTPATLADLREQTVDQLAAILAGRWDGREEEAT